MPPFRPALLLPATLRAAARVLRDAGDRALHPRRRAAAVARLGGAPAAAVLFVCEGNIYRSPYAAGAFAAALPPDARARVAVSSAGFVGGGRPSPPAAVAEAAARAVELRSHVSRLVLAPLLGPATLVVVMEPRQRRALLARFGVAPGRVLVLGDLDPRRAATRAIPDPWGRGGAVLAASYDRIDRCVRALAAALAPAAAGGAASVSAAPGRGGGWAAAEPGAAAATAGAA
ncbi:MAG: hypothetical protein ACJ8J0_26920 [Longimicrobiaceae bacterium]